MLGRFGGRSAREESSWKRQIEPGCHNLDCEAEAASEPELMPSSYSVSGVMCVSKRRGYIPA